MKTKKIRSIILTLAMTLSLLPMPVSVSAEDAPNASLLEYVGSNGNTVNISEYHNVESNDTVWNSGNCVVSGKVDIPHTVTVNGEVNLILCDGAELTVTGDEYFAGIYLTPGNTLNIFGQSRGDGALRVTGGDFSAAIGGSGDDDDGSLALDCNAGDVNIYSGRIYPVGDYGAAAIGGAFGGDCGNITIAGGIIQPSIKSEYDDTIGVCFGEGYKDGAKVNTGTLTISGGVIRAICSGGVARCKTATVADNINIYDLKNYSFDYGTRVNQPKNPIKDALIGTFEYIKNGQPEYFDFNKFAIYEGQTTLDSDSFYYVIDNYTLNSPLLAQDHNTIVIADHVTLDARKGKTFGIFSNVYAQSEGAACGKFLLDKVYTLAGVEKKAGSYKIYNRETSLTEGWYYVCEDYDEDDVITVNGNVRIIIADGVSFCAAFEKQNGGTVTAYTESIGEHKGYFEEYDVEKEPTAEDCPEGYYLAYNTERRKLCAEPIPQNAQKLTYSASGDLVLDGDWYYVKGNVSVNGKIITQKTVHLILLDGSSVTCNKFDCNGHLYLYGQSTDNSKMGKLTVNPSKNIDGIETHSVQYIVFVHGGSINIECECDEPGVYPIDTSLFRMYGGAMNLQADSYISTGGFRRVRVYENAIKYGTYFDTCMLNIWADDKRTTSTNANGNKLVVETKPFKEHITPQKTAEVLPVPGEDGTIIDGVCEYYTCACGCNFANEALTKQIADLEQWKKNEGKLKGVKVFFDYGYDEKTEIEVVAAGRAASQPAAVKRDGYALLGWFDDNGIEWNFSSPINEDMTLRARWHKHKWSEKWSANDTHHWHECEEADCPVKDIEQMDSYETHEFSDFYCTKCQKPEKIEKIKQYALDRIDEKAAECPSEICAAKVTELAAQAKTAIANAVKPEEIFGILENYLDNVLVSAWSVTYYDESGEAKILDDYALLKAEDGDAVTLTADKWYVAEKDIDFSNLIIADGDAHLLLRDGVTINAAKGILVSSGNGLTVYSESDGENMGSLIAYGDRGAAAIGGNFEHYNAGDVTINGGNVIAEGGIGAAAIGGGLGGVGNSLTVNGGYVEAFSGSAGIYFCSVTIDNKMLVFDENHMLVTLPQDSTWSDVLTKNSYRIVKNAPNSISLNLEENTFSVKVNGRDKGTGTVIVALYDSENLSRLLDVKCFDFGKTQNAEDTFNKSGYVKVMWWSEANIMTPLCDAVGKELKITEP